MPPIITIRNLAMSYGDKTVLRGINLDVEPGHVLGYIGPNGAGKTTTVKILIGMLGGFTGEVTVCGHNVATEPLEVKRRIGYVPEAAALYEALTPVEYLRFIGRMYNLADAEVDQRAREMLDLFGLGPELDNRMSTFSKGMRQKVLIIAGMIHNPDVLFLDEPLSGLDANAVVTVKEIISRLAGRGKTIFYCSHVMDVVERVCDRIVIISGGDIVADGSFEQLQASNTAASLEHIFTQLTGDGGHEALADRIIGTFAREKPGHD
jgi:ABC-2 type transport system ATP-binding protein